jgi:hypothetical protein
MKSNPCLSFGSNRKEAFEYYREEAAWGWRQ